MDNTITLYKWILDELTVSARARSVQKIAPYLSSLVHPGNEVLDLCSGTGPTSFWFEEQGVRVTGIDFAPYMIAEAREEACRRGSSVKFLEADITRHDFGTGRYDLIGVFGNSITDFPLSDFAALGKKAAAALKPNGKFVVQYQDAGYRFFQGSTVRGGVHRETPERLTFTFKDYLPEIGACERVWRNETRGEEYHRIGYIYTVPVVELAMGPVFERVGHHVLDIDHFLDVFARREPTV